jgi:glutaminyl-peptide cyclotransferase
MSLLNICSIIIISFLCYDIHLVQTRRVKHNVKSIDAKQYQCFSTLADNPDGFRENLLRPLLIQRVSGTPGNAQARQHILSKLYSTNLWNIELDTFDAMTPDGQVEFTNIVATLDPAAPRRLVLACHYDSKKLPYFIGATDSSVPCAILLDIAISLQQKLSALKQSRGNPTLQLIFFDGEEAVRQWTATDSIYGSRHLATKMRHTNVQGQQNLNQIDAMDMFVLLDLIGHKDIQFVNFFDRTTGKYYNRLRDIETGLLRSYATNNMNTQKRAVFTSQVFGGQIEDDHIPFLNYDVPILHLIASPFPPTWHTVNDNEANLDFTSITHIRNIMKIFVIEYLHLQQQIC